MDVHERNKYRGKKIQKKNKCNLNIIDRKKIFYNIMLCIIIDLTELRPIPIDMS